ncbi:MAG: DUF5060 domain-containing protein [Ferruginibacter sp.]
MKKHLSLYSIVLLLSLCNGFLVAQKPSNSSQRPLSVPVINAVFPSGSSIPRLHKFEVNIDLSAVYVNPYDYDEIRIQCIFDAPSGRKDTVEGFYMQDYILNANGSLSSTGPGSFRVRYAPNETGDWRYELSCTNSGGTAIYPPQSFQCIASSEPGFIRRNSSNYLSFDNGAQFIPIGENMGWQNGNVVTDYTNWLNNLTANGGNFIRVWMASWAFGLEWKNGYNGFSGLKNYKQSSAFYFDWLVDFCRQKNVYIMTTLNNHGQVSTGVNPEWTDNPYNAVNGGPAINTWDFFTNTTAKNLHKNRLRYIIARYGYAQSIQSWELFNEIDWTDQFDTRKPAVKDWHEDMVNFIKSKDVYKHLVTTSFARDINDDATWNIPGIDFSQTHYYVDAPNIENTIAAGSQNYLNKFQKPTLNGEFGLGPDGSTLSPNDPAGVHIHNAIWGSSFSGAMGSGLSWWWDDYIQPKNLYYHFKPLATVLNDLQFVRDNYKKVNTASNGGGSSDATVVPAADFGSPVSSSFTVDATGNILPGASQLGKYLFGSVWNTQFHVPPTFNVNYPVAGQFKVVTGNATGSSPMVNIYVDGTMMVNSSAAINTTYSVNITAGPHAIKVDNLGTDWILISNYVFTNIGSPITTYALRSADGYKAAGYVLNNKYNWKYLQSSGGVVPPAISGANLQISGMQNGDCTIQYFSCSTGLLLSTTSANVVSGNLNLPLPAIAWDIAFRAFVNAYLFTGNGSWNNPANWSNNKIPPSTLPAGSEIIINPIAGGECILDVTQSIIAGAKLTVLPNKKLRVNGNLIIR